MLCFERERLGRYIDDRFQPAPQEWQMPRWRQTLSGKDVFEGHAISGAHVYDLVIGSAHSSA